MEVRKYKNISLKCIKEMQRLGGKVPGYATKLVKEEESGEAYDGLKKQSTGLGSVLDGGDADFEDASMFEGQSELNEEIPEGVQARMDKLQDTVSRLNLEIKDKNEKIIELLSETEEIKIQVFARDKSIQLLQNQIDELLEELRESKSLENDVKILVQKKLALESENEKLRVELEELFFNQAGEDDQLRDLLTTNRQFAEEAKKYHQTIIKQKTEFQAEVARVKQDANEQVRKLKKQYEDKMGYDKDILN